MMSKWVFVLNLNSAVNGAGALRRLRCRAQRQAAETNGGLGGVRLSRALQHNPRQRDRICPKVGVNNIAAPEDGRPPFAVARRSGHRYFGVRGLKN